VASLARNVRLIPSHPSNPSAFCYMGIGSYRILTGPRITMWQMQAKHKLSCWNNSIKFVCLYSYNMPHTSSTNIYTPACISLCIVVRLSVSLTWRGNSRNEVTREFQWMLRCCAGSADHVIPQGSIVLRSVLCLSKRSFRAWWWLWCWCRCCW
jgi:hypothetical protein